MLRLAVVLLGIAATLGAVPWQDSPQRPTISVETDLVMLPVTVVDRDGAFVTGLSREHFAVYDDGVLQPIQFFTSDAMPATVGILIDCSSSMRARRAEVTAAATAFGASAHPLDELFTMNFNEMVWPGLPHGVAFSQSVDQLHHALARAPAVGMTALYDAVARSLDHLRLGTRDRRALIIVSDGGDNASTQTLASVLERARREGAAMYAVTLVDPDAHDAKPHVLKRLARETGGDVFTPRRVDDVMKAFARIADEIRTGYMLGFTPSSEGGGFHQVRVTVNAGDGRPLTVRTRAGYHAGQAHDTAR
jgi:Ca-activated chloride channel homolog